MTLLQTSPEDGDPPLEEQAQTILAAYLQEYWNSVPALDHPAYDLMRQITHERLKVRLILAALQKVQQNVSLDAELHANLMRSLISGRLTYTGEEIQEMLQCIRSIFAHEPPSVLSAALFALVLDFENTLRQADMLALCRDEVEALYAQAHVWEKYNPLDDAYLLRVLLGDLLLADKAPGLASLLRYGLNAGSQTLAEQAQTLLAAYQQELGDYNSAWSLHPALGLLQQVTSERLKVFLIRAALKNISTLLSVSDDYILVRQITGIIDVISTENLAYTAEDLQYILTACLHIFSQQRGSSYTQEIVHSTLFALLRSCEPFLRQADILTYCQDVLASLYALARQWGNYRPIKEAHRVRVLVGDLLFPGYLPELASLLRAYANAASLALEEQARTLLVVYHQDLGDCDQPLEHPLFELMKQETSERLKVRLIRNALQEAYAGFQKHSSLYYHSLPPDLKQTIDLIKALFSESLPYSREDIRSLLECMGNIFTLPDPHYTLFDDSAYIREPFFLRLLNAFVPHLQQPETLAFCRQDMAQLYSSVSQYGWRGQEDYVNRLRLLLRTILFPGSRGPLRDLLQSRRASFESDTEIQALLAAYHQDLGNGTPSVMEAGIVPLFNQKLTPQAVVRLLCLTVEEGRQLKMLRERPGADDDAYLNEQSLLLIRSLCKKSLPFSPEDLHTLLYGILAFQNVVWTIPFLLNTLASQFSRAEVVERCYEDLETIQQLAYEQQWLAGYATEKRQFQLRLTDLLSTRQQQFRAPLLPDAWASPILAELASLPVAQLAPWLSILNHCASAKGTGPSQAWLAQARSLSAAVEDEIFTGTVHRWISLFSDKRGERMDSSNSDILRGLIWLCTGSTERTLAAILADTAIEGYRKLPGQGPRSPKAGDAAVTTLESMRGRDAIGQLERVRQHVKQPSYQEKIGLALDAVAQRENMTRIDLEELMVPTFGLHAGQLHVPVGSWTVQLSVGGRSVQQHWIDPEGHPHSSLPATVKRTAKEELKTVTRLVCDIEHLVGTQRDRLERMFLHERHWPLEDWRERYLAHPLLSVLTQRLIWQVQAGEQSWVVIWHEGRLVDLDTQPIELPAQAEVTLWHPLMSSTADVQRWCLWLEAQRVTQPFKQAHREIYPLTEAERVSGRISLRFSGHFVRQHQLLALARARGWHFSLQHEFSGSLQDDPATLALPSLGLRAEFALNRQPTEDESISRYLTTSQVRFPLLHLAPHGYSHPMQLQPLEQIPPIVFSEVMRDVDLFVSVTSAGADPNRDEQPGPIQDYWLNYNQSDLSLSAQGRKQVLERLIPRLTIAERCSFEERFLRVRGDLCTYRIHLGSGNILMEPGSRYLCIVLSAQKHETAEGQFFLPFEGDQLLSLILSKAFLLAEDTQIKDKSILSQIRS